MKIAMSAPDNGFTSAILQGLKQRLPGDELLPWQPKTEAPANDIEIIIGMGASDARADAIAAQAGAGSDGQ